MTISSTLPKTFMPRTVAVQRRRECLGRLGLTPSPTPDFDKFFHVPSSEHWSLSLPASLNLLLFYLPFWILSSVFPPPEQRGRDGNPGQGQKLSLILGDDAASREDLHREGRGEDKTLVIWSPTRTFFRLTVKEKVKLSKRLQPCSFPHSGGLC